MLPRLSLSLALGLAAVPLGRADATDAPPAGLPPGETALGLAMLALVSAAAAIAFALYARRLAEHAAQEAGLARARATQADGQGVTPDALAAAERVWSTRISALEAQLASLSPRSGSSRTTAPMGTDLGSRLETLERIVAGHGVNLRELSRQPVAAPVVAAPSESSTMVWPSALAADTPAMHDVRQTLAVALKSRVPAAGELLDRLRRLERWAVEKPGANEVAAALTEISTLLFGALRRGAAVAPLDSALLSDRVLAALRPAWKEFQPQLDCRSFFPGSTFDPDWMDAPAGSGLQRPVISEMISWAVFEKIDHSRRILAKARVATD
jgi:hypothetical protein